MGMEVQPSQKSHANSVSVDPVSGSLKARGSTIDEDYCATITEYYVRTE